MDMANPLICQQSPPPATPLGFEPVTLALIPLVGPQALPTLLKSIAVRKGAYPSLIVHSPKRPRRTQGELMDTANPPICQQHGVDYTEVFASVARMDTDRMIIALAAQRNWTIYQLDVKLAFLHGELSEEVFVEQPRGYEQKNNPHKVYKLKKALYGLKQAPRAWFSHIEAHFVNEGFERCHNEHTLFVKTIKGGKILILSLYVDDLIFTGNDESMFYEFKSSMMREFDMTDLGKIRYFLGFEVED